MPVLILVGIILILVLWVVSVFNRLVNLRNRRQNAFADIDVQLRQRHDLVYQLVETVKGYASHEKEVLTRVTEARSAAIAAKSIDDKIRAEQQLTGALQGLRFQAEAYPNLKANENFMHLQGEITELEDKLAASRRHFNAATTEYNTALESFPGNVIGRNFGFNREIMFDLGTETRKVFEEPPKIQF
jgi:LemA protein